MGKKVIFAEATDGTLSIGSQADATIGDVITTIASSDTVLTGGHGLAQKLALVEIGVVAGGMSAGRTLVQAATFGRAG